MGSSWYYVDENRRVGPVEEREIELLIEQKKLSGESYVWRKGLGDWELLKDQKELQKYMEDKTVSKQDRNRGSEVENIPPLDFPRGESSWRGEGSGFDWSQVDDSVSFSIKTGHDRGGTEGLYGPFSRDQIKRAFQEKRINERTFIYAHGMKDWVFFGDTPLFEECSGGLPAVIKDEDRRVNQRKPFVARSFFADENSFFEGICRDISVGGLQVLTADFSGQVGDQVKMNVHPDNSEYSFVATGMITRILEGGGFSLRFENLSSEAMKAIESYIKSN